ncbi:hypothetical protein SAMD00019534_082760 [Acytostelium subglobosum LB1]|uniref:hypothetical protein n=1 Tax=Acytostelium subglobosum LB1 TaxID=1410327 RepID=UPI00064509DE|nr:hypothetical protein SAMD00019534_082760 [Acytostelium subglobosum LB1]GAM25101.1 hypothetical protein SAMD00019534_082760 [Acytostelium subglobosum LB1]|eukprot:XP_012752190.1 hypothetical protein SAMD00019534_082760 [Acytostelium subglobosum LB1]
MTSTSLTSLSHLLLRHIVSYLDNVDIVCVVLSSKSMFNDRCKYARLSVQSLKDRSIYDNNNDNDSSNSSSNNNNINTMFNLGSFKQLIMNSLNGDADHFSGQQHQQLPQQQQNARQQKARERLQSNDFMVINHLSNLKTLELNTKVVRIKFNDTFNQPLLPGCIPDHVRHLSFGEKYNRPLRAGVLPQQLQSLYLGWSFDLSLPAGILPQSLLRLMLASYRPHPSRVLCIPDSVTYLKIYDSFANSFPTSSIPSSVKRLSFGFEINEPLPTGLIPAGLDYLAVKLWRYLTSATPITFCPIPPGTIPSGITTLNLGRRFDMALQQGSVPNGVQHLVISSSFFKCNKFDVLPSSIRTLTIHPNSNQSKSYTIAIRPLGINTTMVIDQSLHGYVVVVVGDGGGTDYIMLALQRLIQFNEESISDRIKRLFPITGAIAEDQFIQYT